MCLVTHAKPEQVIDIRLVYRYSEGKVVVALPELKPGEYRPAVILKGDEKKETTDLKYNRGDDLADLLNQYQDYTDQRLAIERKFNEDIATLQEQRKQAVKNGDTEQVEQN